MKHKIGVLGAGTWGMALARMLTVSGNEVQVWSALPAEVDSLSTTRVHPNLPGMKIPAELQFTKSIVVERTNTDGTANSSTSLPVHTSSMLLVKRSSCGMTIPGRLGCTRVVERLSTSASMADHTCTSLPLTVSIRARAMPQVPAPRTPILNFFTFVSSVSAPGKGKPPAGGFAPRRAVAPRLRTTMSIVHESAHSVKHLPHCTNI